MSSNPADWKCDFTGVTDNLWLNLSDGTIGSGRRQWDGSGGNGAPRGTPPHATYTAGHPRAACVRAGAALEHFHETGDKYPLVVKLGTITPHGADVFSYAADENDLVLDPHLKAHLRHWGVDMDTMEKTAKTMSELQARRHAPHTRARQSACSLVCGLSPVSYAAASCALPQQRRAPDRRLCLRRWIST